MVPPADGRLNTGAIRGQARRALVAGELERMDPELPEPDPGVDPDSI